MKQHLTVKQVNEAPEELLIKLGYADVVAAHKEVAAELISKQINIGFMIEYLGKGVLLNYIDGKGHVSILTDLTKGVFGNPATIDDVKHFHADNLCDALWQAIVDTIYPYI